MKKIWLINQYAMPPELESRLRTIKFAQYLSQKGYEVTIFASSIMHNMGIDLISDNKIYLEKSYEDIKFVHIKSKFYKTNGMNRIISSLQFHFRLKKYIKKLKKPDVILHTAYIPFGLGLYYTAKRLNSKYIVEIVDLWPETFVELGVIKKGNPLLYFAYLAERWLYQRADNVVFSMEGGINYIQDKKWDIENGGKINLEKIHYINNGVDLADFKKNLETHILDDKDLSNTDIKKIVYLGSIRLANNLKQLVDAASLLRFHKDIVFLLYGNGEDRERLEKYCIEQSIDNIIFKEKWIDPKYVPYVLSCSTVNILNYMPGHFGGYGGSQSKMFQYMASGKPICCNLNMMYCPITKNNLGIAKEFNSVQEYADAIYKLSNLSKHDSDELCKRNILTAKAFDYQVLTEKMIKVF
ncbi:MAG: glycosyltransferase family 4 protein [Ferruginibacter sp.]